MSKSGIIEELNNIRAQFPGGSFEENALQRAISGLKLGADSRIIAGWLINITCLPGFSLQDSVTIVDIANRLGV